MTSPSSTSMTQEMQEKWRADTKREWSEAQKVEAWRKWGRKNLAAQHEGTRLLITEAEIEPGHHVLDVAGGGGDPALAVAKAVGPGGKVSVTDVSPGMLETTQQFANEDGLLNIEYHEADAENLPFPDATFDRAVCRCGVMFFADLDRGLREMRRVLRPGGRAAFLAWGSIEQNGLFASMFGPVRKYLAPPSPPPGTPWPFRFAEAGTLAAALEAAGYKHVSERLVPSHYQFQGSADEILQLMLDMGGLHGMLAELPPDMREALLSEALDNFRAFATDDFVAPTLAYVLASGRA